jgi:C4-dicarboxylate-specific signal transduction histidine kinase
MYTSSPENTVPPRFPELNAVLRLQERLLQVSRLATLGELSSGIAHELNQPLCAVANYSQACHRLLSQPEPDIDEVRDTLLEITSQALRAAEVVRRLRSLARPHEAHCDPTDVNRLLYELTDLIESDAKHHQVRYRLEAGVGVPNVCADGSQIQQLVLNLVRNAIEAQADIPPEGREVTVRSAYLDDVQAVEICVSDRGPGVPASIAAHLFAPFYTTKSGGTGLGLAMSSTIAKANAGTLEYRPNQPHGACFRLRLPAAPATQATQPPPAAQETVDAVVRT